MSHKVTTLEALETLAAALDARDFPAPARFVLRMGGEDKVIESNGTYAALPQWLKAHKGVAPLNMRRVMVKVMQQLGEVENKTLFYPFCQDRAFVFDMQEYTSRWMPEGIIFSVPCRFWKMDEGFAHNVPVHEALHEAYRHGHDEVHVPYFGACLRLDKLLYGEESKVDRLVEIRTNRKYINPLPTVQFPYKNMLRDSFAGQAAARRKRVRDYGRYEEVRLKELRLNSETCMVAGEYLNGAERSLGGSNLVKEYLERIIQLDMEICGRRVPKEQKNTWRQELRSLLVAEHDRLWGREPIMSMDVVLHDLVKEGELERVTGDACFVRDAQGYMRREPGGVLGDAIRRYTTLIAQNDPSAATVREEIEAEVKQSLCTVERQMRAHLCGRILAGMAR